MSKLDHDTDELGIGTKVIIVDKAQSKSALHPRVRVTRCMSEASQAICLLGPTYSSSVIDTPVNSR